MGFPDDSDGKESACKSFSPEGENKNEKILLGFVIHHPPTRSQFGRNRHQPLG